MNKLAKSFEFVCSSYVNLIWTVEDGYFEAYGCDWQCVVAKVYFDGSISWY